MASTKRIWVANNFHVDCSGLRAASGKRQAVTSGKLQAASNKRQAPSSKLQATSRKQQAAE